MGGAIGTDAAACKSYKLVEDDDNDENQAPSNLRSRSILRGASYAARNERDRTIGPTTGSGTARFSPGILFNNDRLLNRGGGVRGGGTRGGGGGGASVGDNVFIGIDDGNDLGRTSRFKSALVTSSCGNGNGGGGVYEWNRASQRNRRVPGAP